MSTYRIVDWDKHYEVDAHGKPWESGQPFRKGPLQYIRVRARRDWNVRLLELHDAWGEQVWMLTGIFSKLCQIVGAEERPQRAGGIIRNCDGDPATDRDICRMLGLEPETWKAVAAALCHATIHWLEEEETPTAERFSRETTHVPETPPAPGNPGIPATPGIPQSSQVKSKQNKPNQNKSRGPVSLGMALGPLVPVPAAAVLDPTAPHPLSSTRLDFMHQIRSTLGAQEAADCRTVSNFEDWVHTNISSGRAGPELRQTALNLARDCVRGEKPVAVFLARAKQELGYIAPSRRPGAAPTQEGKL